MELRDTVVVPVGLLVSEPVGLWVLLGVPVLDPVPDPLVVTLAVAEVLAEGAGVRLLEGVELKDAELESVAVPVADGAADAEGEAAADPLAEEDGDELDLVVMEEVADAEPDAV